MLFAWQDRRACKDTKDMQLSYPRKHYLIAVADTHMASQIGLWRVLRVNLSTLLIPFHLMYLKLGSFLPTPNQPQTSINHKLPLFFFSQRKIAHFCPIIRECEEETFLSIFSLSNLLYNNC